MDEVRCQISRRDIVIGVTMLSHWQQRAGRVVSLLSLSPASAGADELRQPVVNYAASAD